MKKIFFIFALILVLIVPLSGCGYLSDPDILSQLKAWLADYNSDQEDSEDGEGGTADGVLIRLTYPAGRSPNVFTTGWVFGASCTADGEDYSDQVKWSGTGSFTPDTGTRARPSFASEGSNTITLSVTIDDKNYSRKFNVTAVSPAGYACTGMMAVCPADSHGGPSDPLSVMGPITSGSSHVFVNGKPAARAGDVGVHCACVGSNTFEIVGGDSSVLIDGKPAAKIGSTTKHCGGMGSIIGTVR